MFQTNQMINHEMWSKLGGLTAWVDHFLTHQWTILDPRCCWDVWFGWSWAHHPMLQGDTDMKINRPTSTITIQLENLSNFLGLGSSVVFTDRFTKLMLPHLAICGKVSGVYQSPSGWRGYPRIRDDHESLRIVYLRGGSHPVMSRKSMFERRPLSETRLICTIYIDIPQVGAFTMFFPPEKSREWVFFKSTTWICLRNPHRINHNYSP